MSSMTKKYQYLVTYVCQKEGYIGSCTVVSQLYRNKKIKSFNDINEITRFLSESDKTISNVAITNFILLGRHKFYDR